MICFLLLIDDSLKVTVPFCDRVCCQEEVCSSQASGEVFASPAWQMLLADLEPCTDDVLRKFSVQAMLHKVSLLPQTMHFNLFTVFPPLRGL